MTIRAIFIVLALVICRVANTSEEIIFGNGFGQNINWIDYKSAISDSSKPSMIILHKSWCSACKTLKPKLAQSLDFDKLSGKFSMVNANEGDPIHNLAEFDLDGSYIPRILFLDQDGKVLQDIKNIDGNDNYKYYYFTEDSVLSSMKSVLEQISEEQPNEEL